MGFCLSVLDPRFLLVFIQRLLDYVGEETGDQNDRF